MNTLLEMLILMGTYLLCGMVTCAIFVKQDDLDLDWDNDRPLVILCVLAWWVVWFVVAVFKFWRVIIFGIKVIEKLLPPWRRK